VRLKALTNAFFLWSRDSETRGGVARRVAHSQRFRSVTMPAPGWLAATAPVTAEGPSSAVDATPGGVFLEGAPAQRRAMIGLALRDPSKLERYPGDFAFAAFAREGPATFVRSCGGLVPLYWWSGDDCVAVATRLEDLVRFGRVPARIDPLTCALWAGGCGTFPDDRAPVAGVSVLPRGCALIVAASGRCRVVRYWDPTPPRLAGPTKTSMDAHAARLRGILSTRLREDLSEQGGNLLTLSGGVDSTSLAALAVDRAGRDVWTWSLLPPPGPKLDGETRYIDPLLRDLGIERNWRFHHRPDERLALLEAAPPTAFPIAHPALCDLPRVCREAPVRVLFGGEFADEICGSGFTFPDWVAHTSISDLLRSAGRWPKGRRDPMRWLRLRYQFLRGQPPLPFPARLPAFAPGHLNAEYVEWRDRLERAVAHDRRPWRYLRLHMRLDAFVAMNWEATSALGVQRSFPFFNREALELVMACHPRELVGPGNKRLLRRALSGHVYERNLMRPDKGHWHADFSGSASFDLGDAMDKLAPMLDPEWLARHAHALSFDQAHGLVLMRTFARRLADLNHRSKVSE